MRPKINPAIRFVPSTLRKWGWISAALIFMVGGMLTTFMAGEAVRPRVSAEGLGYPWPSDTEAPCEFGDAGGPSCANPAPDRSTDKYNWGVHDAHGTFRKYRNGYEYRNCTDYVQWKEGTMGVVVPGNLMNGGQWYDNVPPNERSLTPNAWDAAVVPGNPGHVAFIESVNLDDTITVSEYNHDTHGHGDMRTGRPADMGFTEFIDFGTHPDGSPPAALPVPHARGDFTYDGKADIAWYERWKNTVSILQSNGTTLQIQPWQTGIGGPDWAGTGDFDGNGLTDIAWYEKWKNRITVLINHGGNVFSLEDFMDGVGGPTWAGVGDFDGDGKDDIAWYERWQTSMAILHSNGSNAFETRAGISGIGGPDWAGTGDFDGDGKADIAWYEWWKSSITILKSNAPSSFDLYTGVSGIGGPDWASSRGGSLPGSNGG